MLIMTEELIDEKFKKIFAERRCQVAAQEEVFSNEELKTIINKESYTLQLRLLSQLILEIREMKTDISSKLEAFHDDIL